MMNWNFPIFPIYCQHFRAVIIIILLLVCCIYFSIYWFLNNVFQMKIRFFFEKKKNCLFFSVVNSFLILFRYRIHCSCCVWTLSETKFLGLNVDRYILPGIYIVCMYGIRLPFFILSCFVFLHKHKQTVNK
mgnify:CR=1 FL=1